MRANIDQVRAAGAAANSANPHLNPQSYQQQLIEGMQNVNLGGPNAGVPGHVVSGGPGAIRNAQGLASQQAILHPSSAPFRMMQPGGFHSADPQFHIGSHQQYQIQGGHPPPYGAPIQQPSHSSINYQHYMQMQNINQSGASSGSALGHQMPQSNISLTSRGDPQRPNSAFPNLSSSHHLDLMGNSGGDFPYPHQFVAVQHGTSATGLSRRLFAPASSVSYLGSGAAHQSAHENEDSQLQQRYRPSSTFDESLKHQHPPTQTQPNTVPSLGTDGLRQQEAFVGGGDSIFSRSPIEGFGLDPMNTSLPLAQTASIFAPGERFIPGSSMVNQLPPVQHISQENSQSKGSYPQRQKSQDQKGDATLSPSRTLGDTQKLHHHHSSHQVLLGTDQTEQMMSPYQTTQGINSGSSTSRGGHFRKGPRQKSNEVVIHNIDKTTIYHIAQELHQQDVIDISQSLIERNILIVRFRNQQGAQWAINKYDGQVINGRELQVTIAVDTAHINKKRHAKWELTNLAQINETADVDEDLEQESSDEKPHAQSTLQNNSQTQNNPPQGNRNKSLRHGSQGPATNPQPPVSDQQKLGLLPQQLPIGENMLSASESLQPKFQSSTPTVFTPQQNQARLQQPQERPKAFPSPFNTHQQFYPQQLPQMYQPQQSFPQMNHPVGGYQTQQFPQFTGGDISGSRGQGAPETQPIGVPQPGFTLQRSSPQPQFQQYMQSQQQQQFFNPSKFNISLTSAGVGPASQTFNAPQSQVQDLLHLDQNPFHPADQQPLNTHDQKRSLSNQSGFRMSAPCITAQDQLNQLIDQGFPSGSGFPSTLMHPPQNWSSSIENSQQDDNDNFNHEHQLSGSDRGSLVYQQNPMNMTTRNVMVTTSTRNSDSDKSAKFKKLLFNQTQQFQSPISGRKTMQIYQENSFEYNRNPQSNSGHDTPPYLTPGQTKNLSNSFHQMFQGQNTSSVPSLTQIRSTEMHLGGGHIRNLSHNQQMMIHQDLLNPFIMQQPGSMGGVQQNQFYMSQQIQTNVLQRSISYAHPNFHSSSSEMGNDMHLYERSLNIGQMMNPCQPGGQQQQQIQPQQYPQYGGATGQDLNLAISSSNSSFDFSNHSGPKQQLKHNKKGQGGGQGGGNKNYQSHQNLKYQTYSESSETSDQAMYQLDYEKIKSGEDKRTTVMVRHIPNRYTQRLLLTEINRNHQGKYDFFYLPIDYKNSANVGYAFVNFVNHLFILDFFQEFHGRSWERFNSKKRCDIRYGRLQGLEELKRHFQSSSVMNQTDENYRPRIFEQHNKMDWTQELKKIIEKHKINTSTHQFQSNSQATSRSQSSMNQNSHNRQPSISSNNTLSATQGLSSIQRQVETVTEQEEEKESGHQ